MSYLTSPRREETPERAKRRCDPGDVATVGREGRGQLRSHESFGHRPDEGHHQEPQEAQQRASASDSRYVRLGMYMNI